MKQRLPATKMVIRSDKQLRVKVRPEKPGEDFLEMMQPREYIRPPLWVIVIEFIQDYRGLECRCLTVEMRARYTGNDERFREELMDSKILSEFRISSECTAWDKSTQEIEVVLDDPHDIIAWLFPQMDFNDFFKQQNLLNDRPLQLPAKH